MRTALAALMVALTVTSYAQPTLSPLTQQLALQLETTGTVGEKLQSRILVQNHQTRALMKVKPGTQPSDFQLASFHVNTTAGDIWSVTFSLETLTALQSHPKVMQLEVAEKTAMSQPSIDRARKAVSADKVRYGLQGIPRAYTGKDVIIGIIDIGFQNTHPTFYTADGQRSRILAYWNQNSQSGPSPEGFDYGRLTTSTADIEEEWLNNEVETHATMVAGIAGGSGRGSDSLRYEGVAPGADLAFVELKYTNEEFPWGSSKSDLVVGAPHIIDGLSYLFSMAEKRNRPIVVNLSWTMHTGPHDGTSLFDQAVDNLVGPRKIFIGGAGNSGSEAIHLKTTLRPDDTARTVPISSIRSFLQSNRWGETSMVDAWGHKGSSFATSVSVLNRSGEVLIQTAFVPSSRNQMIDTILVWDEDTFNISFFCQAAYEGNGKPNIRTEVINPSAYKYFTALNWVTSEDSCEMNAWNEGSIYDNISGMFIKLIQTKEKYLAGDPNSTVGENGGTAHGIITVGSYNTRNVYTNHMDQEIKLGTQENAISDFSSRGPTADGRIKPDVLAPGGGIVSAYNKLYFHPIYSTDVVEMNVLNDTAAWAVGSGTSFAAPVVTGVVALMLEADPWLTPERVRSILQQTAVSDKFTGTTPNNAAGHGKINALEAVILTRNTGIDGPNRARIETIEVFPNPTTSAISVKTEMQNPKWIVYNLMGEELLTGQGVEPISTDGLGAGEYLLFLQEDGKMATAYFQVMN